MKKIWFLVVLFIVFISSGCATYTFNNVNYDTPEKALSAQAQLQKEISDQITPTDTPINGSVVVILPSDSLILKEYVQVKGKGTPSKDKSNPLLNYVITSFKSSMGFLADYLIKRKLFTDVKVIDSENLENADFSEDFAIYATKEGPVLKKKGLRDSIPIHFNPNPKLTPKERIMDWFIKVENAAK